ncbi:MAG: ABC transporter permease [Gaiellaceae bacterium]
MKVLAIATVELRRLFRYRANVFFLFVLPMLIILLLGAAFGSADARVGVTGASGPLGKQLASALEARPNLDLERFADEDSLEEAVQRGEVQAGLVVPSDYDAALRGGRVVMLRYFARPDSLAQELRATVEAAIAEQSLVLRAARFLEQEGIAAFSQALVRAEVAAATVPRVQTRLTTPEGEPYPEESGRFEEGASTQLLLFIFLNSLIAASALIEARRLGVARRMLSTPTPVRTILAGQALGRLGIALAQAAIIIVGSALLFGVDWGSPPAVAALVLAFCLVGCGAGMLLGSTLRNEAQAGAVALLVGLGLAAFGGSMVPLEVFPDAVRTAAHTTPHAWGNEAFSDLLARDTGLADVLPEIAVLLGYASVLLALAVWRLHATLTR